MHLSIFPSPPTPSLCSFPYCPECQEDLASQGAFLPTQEQAECVSGGGDFGQSQEVAQSSVRSGGVFFSSSSGLPAGAVSLV